MEKSKVFFTDFHTVPFGDGLPVKLQKLIRRAGIGDIDMVDDLMFLHRTGRVSGVKAFAGKALGLRPLLKGDDTGHIVVCGKARGRKAALESLLADFDAHILPDSHQTVAVAHCDSEKEAQFMADHMAKNPAVDKVIIEWYEQCTGSHLGPGAVAIFYVADHR